MRTTTTILVAMTLLVCSLAASGCATLLAGGPDQVQVASNPAGARVILDGQDMGETPTVIMLDRERSMGNIRIEAAGYQPVVVQRAKVFNTVAILNCLGMLGWVIDLVTGNVKKFETSPINVSLVPGAGAPGAYPAPGPVPPVAPAPAGGGPGSLRKPQ